MPDDKLPIPEFAKRIKAKYPQYADMNDTLLVQKIVDKYPDYQDQVDLSGLSKKKDVSIGGNVSQPSSQNTTSTLGGEKSQNVYDPVRDALNPLRQQFQQAQNDFNPLRNRAISDNTRQAVLPVGVKNEQFNQSDFNQKQQQEQVANTQLTHTENAIRRHIGNAKVAKAVLDDVKKNNGGVVPKDNEAGTMATQSLNDFNNLSKDIIDNKGIVGAAINEEVKNNPEFANRYKTLDGKIPKSYEGKLLYGYLQRHGENVQNFVEEHPEYQKEFDDLTKNFAEKYPETTAAQIGNEVSQAYEKNAKTHDSFATLTSDNSKIDNVASTLYKDNPEKLALYNKLVKDNKDKYIKSAAALNSFGGEIFGGLNSTMNSLRDVTGLRNAKDMAFDELDKSATDINPHTTGIRDFVSTSSGFLGMITQVASAGGVLKGLGAAKIGAEAVPTITRFYDDQLKESEGRFGDSWKAKLSADASTAAFALGGNAIPASKVRGAIENVLKDAGEKESVASVQARVFNAVKETYKQYVKGATEMTAITAAKQITDAALGSPHANAGEELLGSAESMLKGNIAPALIHGIGKYAGTKVEKQNETGNVEPTKEDALNLESAIGELPEGIFTSPLKKADEPTRQQYLKNIAEQLNSSESEANTTRKVFGDKISDLALKLYPDAKPEPIANPIPTTDKTGAEVRSTENGQEPINNTKDGLTTPISGGGEDVGSKTGLIVYHGTPHAFEQFDISKLGSGEGKQAFGHGLYFTNEKSIAEGYANYLSSKQKFWKTLEEGNEISLSKEDYDFVKKELDALGYDGSRADEANVGNIKVDGKDEHDPSVLEALAVVFGKNAKNDLKDYGLSDAEVSRMLEIKRKISDPQLYTATIHKGKSASEYDYLNWHDELSSSQKKKIGDIEGATGEDVYKNLSKKLGSDKAASEYLLFKGIDGIVYKSHKGTGGKTGEGRNYVVFDAKNITIEDINGKPLTKATPISGGGEDVGDKTVERIKNIEDRVKKGDTISADDIVGLKPEREGKWEYTDDEKKIHQDYNAKFNRLKKVESEVIGKLTNGEEVSHEAISEFRNLQKEVKDIEGNLPKGRRGEGEKGVPSFSDMDSFEETQNIDDWKGRIVDIGGNIHVVDNNGKVKPINWVEYNTRTDTYEPIQKPDRVLKYGDKVPQSGEFTVVHASPSGRIDKFDESRFGKGWQREEGDWERLAGVYTNDNTDFNKSLTGYGQAHEYTINYDNAISEKKANKLLSEREKELDRYLTRKEATDYIKSLGYDMAYRDDKDGGSHTFIILDVNKIKPKQPTNETPSEPTTKEQPIEEQAKVPEPIKEETPTEKTAQPTYSQPPIEPPKATGGTEGDNSEWSGIRKEKVLQDIKGAKEVYEKATKQKFSETMQSALEGLAKNHPDKSLYDAAKSHVLEFAQKHDRGEVFNPTSKDLAVFNYFKAETKAKLDSLKDRLNSTNDAERNMALAEGELLENDLTQVAKAVNPQEAGRAFAFRQSEIRNDPEHGLQIRRMELQRANDGNPLSEADEKFLKDNWDKEKEIIKQRHDLEKKSMQEEFDKKLEQVRKEFDEKLKSAKGGKQSVKDKTLSQKGKDVADKIRKLKFNDKGSANVDFTFGTWDLAVEGIAKLVEGGATIAEAIDKLIKDKSLGFKTEEDRKKFENAFVREINNQERRENAIGEIKKIADEAKASSIMPEMVKSGLIKDFVDSHLGKVENEKVLDAALKELKEVLPDTDKEELLEAYIKKGAFKQPTKRQLETAIRQQQKELQKIAKKQLTADQVQKIKLDQEKQNTIKKIDDYKDKITKSEYARPEPPAGLNKYDAELIRLKTAEGKVSIEFKKKQREIEEKNKGWRERVADTARNLYVALLIGGTKTFTKVGLMSLARPFSEAATKLSFGKAFDAIFPNISKAALRGGESSSWKSVEKGFAAYFNQIGAKGMQAKFQKSMDDYRAALDKYNTAKEDGVSGKELKALESDMTNKLLNATGNVVYQYIGGSSLKDAFQALTHRNNHIEEKFGFAPRESIKDGNWLDKSNYILGFIGRSHSALKTFSGRFSFAAGFMARLEAEARDNPQRLAEPNRLMEIAHESYLDFERGKYQQPNYITEKWNHMIRAVDKKFIDHPEWDKYNAAWKALMRGDVAITRVPVNILHEAVMEYTVGAFRAIRMASKELKNAKAQAATEGIEKGIPEFKERVKDIISNMDEKQAATIARCFRKGGLGLGLYAFFLISGVMKFGTFPHMGQAKKKDDDKLAKGELNPDQIQIGDTKLGEGISSAIAHIPALWPSLMGLGMAYQYGRDIQKGKSTPSATWDAVKTHLQIIEGGIPQTKVISPTRIATSAGQAVKKRLTEYGIISDSKDVKNNIPKNLIDPTLKYFTEEKKISVPDFTPEKIITKEVNGKPVEHLSDLPEETQNRYLAERAKNLSSEMRKLKSGAYKLYKDKEGTVKIIGASTDVSEIKKKVSFNNLTQEELQYVVSHILSDKATEETKKKVFHTK